MTLHTRAQVKRKRRPAARGTHQLFSSPVYYTCIRVRGAARKTLRSDLLLPRGRVVVVFFPVRHKFPLVHIL